MARFAAVLALLLALYAAAVRGDQNGDFIEYAMMTVALASHASPDIRLADIEAAKPLLPNFAGPLAELEQGMRENRDVPKSGFYRGRQRAVYAIHFFAYPALAALPFRLLQALGGPPFKCFQLVNLALVFVLGLAMYRLFGSGRKAMLGVAFFLLCGGGLYLDWSSPECLSAAALLAALILYVRAAPVAGGVLAGLASLQNPPIVLFCAFAPLLRCCVEWKREAGLGAAMKAALEPRYLLGIGAAAGLFAFPVLFNLWHFGVPNIIATVSTSVELVSLNRLHSFFFDLNQGMIVGVPGLLAALGLWGWQRQPGSSRLHALALGGAAAAFAIALALPALAAQNWNSLAVGMMRYAFWGAMPFLFVFLWRLHLSARWPAAVVAGVLAVQAGCALYALQYHTLEFSPLARYTLAHAPGWYNPDAEIFHERLEHRERYFEPERIYAYAVDGVTVKTLYNLRNPEAEARLCGPGRALAPDNAVVDGDQQWRYINGAVKCRTALTLAVGQPALRLADGWSTPEHGGGEWEGVWSDAARSRLAIDFDPAQKPSHISLQGRYFDGNKRTRVTINGIDLGWQDLATMPSLALPDGGAVLTPPLTVELEYDAPHRPAARAPEQRRLGFFLQTVTLR
ncbi:MAG TPA: hypothetical protein VFG03_06920 [Telluria sp.]|nr:hypothetical protein [Telluria sp.]